jgi:hypothetical protein
VDRLNDMANKLSFIFRYYQTFSALPSNFGCTALSMVPWVLLECFKESSNIRVNGLLRMFLANFKRSTRVKSI